MWTYDVFCHIKIYKSQLHYDVPNNKCKASKAVGFFPDLHKKSAATISSSIIIIQLGSFLKADI